MDNFPSVTLYLLILTSRNGQKKKLSKLTALDVLLEASHIKYLSRIQQQQSHCCFQPLRNCWPSTLSWVYVNSLEIESYFIKTEFVIKSVKVSQSLISHIVSHKPSYRQVQIVQIIFVLKLFTGELFTLLVCLDRTFPTSHVYIKTNTRPFEYTNQLPMSCDKPRI